MCTVSGRRTIKVIFLTEPKQNDPKPTFTHEIAPRNLK